MKQLWERVPAPLQGLLSVVFVLVLLGASNAVGDSLSPGFALIWYIVLVALAVVLIVTLVRRGKRVIGGGEQYKLLRRAMKSGTVPPEADREAWRVALGRIGDLRSNLWFHGFLGMFIVVVNVAGYVSVRDQLGPGWTVTFFVLLALVLAGWVGLPAWIVQRRRRQARVLLAQLGDPPA